ELVVAPEFLLRPLVLGGEASRALLVAPEVGLGELLLELAEADLQRGGVKGNHGPSRAGPRSPRAARRAGSGSRRPPLRPVALLELFAGAAPARVVAADLLVRARMDGLGDDPSRRRHAGRDRLSPACCRDRRRT